MKPPLRLAYLFSRYPAINHSYLFNEVVHLRRAGVEVHTVSVLAPDRAPERLTPAEREEAARTFYIKPGGWRASLGPLAATLFTRPAAFCRTLLHAVALGRRGPREMAYWLFYFVEAAVLGRWMLARGLSHVHIHYASNVGLLLPRLFPLSVSQSLHGPSEFEDPTGFRLAEKVRDALFVRVISQYGRSQLMRVSDYREWEKIEVARLGVDPELFAPRAFRERPAPFEIICVGRLAPEKGQHVLLDAVAQLVRAGKLPRLRLVGDGPDRAALERHAAASGLAAHVVFSGWVNQDELRELYRQADACALASFQEGIPVALMEPMAMGIPCVATRITGIPELIQHGVNGWLVTPSDSHELAAALARLIEDTALRRQMGEAARRRVLEDYHLAHNAAALARIFARRLAADRAGYNTLDSAMPAETPSKALGAGQ